MSKILVTGGAGYIGCTGAQALIDRGDRVAIYNSLVHAKRRAVSAGAEFVEGEVADLGRLEGCWRSEKSPASCILPRSSSRV